MPQTGFAFVLTDFLHDRLGVQLRDTGIRYDFVSASAERGTGPDDRLDRVETRARALQAFVATEDGANLLAGYKRAANILRIEEKKDASATDGSPAEAGAQLGRPRGGEVGPIPDVVQLDPGLRRGTEDGVSPAEAAPAESALVAALDAAEPAAVRAVEAEDFTAAMTALASLRAPIDAFFDQVTVNDPDPAVRAGRLALLARVREAVHRVADFSKIEG